MTRRSLHETVNFTQHRGSRLPLRALVGPVVGMECLAGIVGP